MNTLILRIDVGFAKPALFFDVKFSNRRDFPQLDAQW